MKKRKLVIALTAGWALGAWAQEPPPEPTGLEPEVIITPGEPGRIEEYRINGRLYMIKVTPAKGSPYYLVDADGDGSLETRQNELGPDLLIPSWVLFEW